MIISIVADARSSLEVIYLLQELSASAAVRPMLPGTGQCHVVAMQVHGPHQIDLLIVGGSIRPYWPAIQTIVALH